MENRDMMIGFPVYDDFFIINYSRHIREIGKKIRIKTKGKVMIEKRDKKMAESIKCYNPKCRKQIFTTEIFIVEMYKENKESFTLLKALFFCKKCYKKVCDMIYNEFKSEK